MDTNKHGAMEQNEEDILMNILIYGTPITELRMRTYGMMKSAPGCENKRLSGKRKSTLGFRIQIWAAWIPRFTGTLAGV